MEHLKNDSAISISPPSPTEKLPGTIKTSDIEGTIIREPLTTLSHGQPQSDFTNGLTSGRKQEDVAASAVDEKDTTHQSSTSDEPAVVQHPGVKDTTSTMAKSLETAGSPQSDREKTPAATALNGNAIQPAEPSPMEHPPEELVEELTDNALSLPNGESSSWAHEHDLPNPHERPVSMLFSPLTHPNGISMFPDLGLDQQEDIAWEAATQAEGSILADSDEISTVQDANSDAGYQSDQRSSASTSVESTVRDYMFENGRRYHRFREGRYNFPNDDIEQEREDMKHAMVKLLCSQKLHFAPIGDHPQQVLDIGTGTGIWAIESKLYAVS
jgi:hypothetical protein